MNILAIDTSTNVLGVGLANEEKIIGEYITNIKRNHSTRVLPAIDFLLRDVGYETQDIDKIVVAEGPGSYTGLRIGVTIGKTLAWTLQIPIAGVSSLKAMAANARYFTGYIAPIMDARRGNIFTGLYQYVDDQLVQKIEDQHTSAEEWAQNLKEMDRPILFIGNDLPLHKETFQAILQENARFASVPINNQRPGELALLGKDEPEHDVHSFVPNYLRLAEAEAKWRERNQVKE